MFPFRKRWGVGKVIGMKRKQGNTVPFFPIRRVVVSGTGFEIVMRRDCVRVICRGLVTQRAALAALILRSLALAEARAALEAEGAGSASWPYR